MKTITSAFFFIFTFQLFSQVVEISGQVRDIHGEAVPGATILLSDSSKGTVADYEGNYSLLVKQSATVTLVVSSVGYTSQQRTLDLSNGSGINVGFQLKENISGLDAVLVVGESKTREIRKKPFNVNIIDTRPLQNANVDISNVLNRSTGINIREEGGLGSGFEFSIHGLSGRQVKFFIDGIPMDNYGTSMTINNIPINLVERVEVFKGMSPVYLGSDALGGSINIVTREDVDNFLDASYSVGSFNTHRAAVSGQHSFANNKAFIRASGFFNYSDNNYTVEVEIPDELGNLDGNRTSVSRFHDGYQSAMIRLKGGLQNLPWADQLAIGLTASGNNNEVQHGISLDRVFGQITTQDRVIIPSLEYQKSGFLIPNLDVRSYASMIQGTYQVVDTSSRTYDWFGNYSFKNNPAIGEAQWEKTLFSFDDEVILATNTLDYSIGQKHSLTLNHTFTRFRRQGDDPLDPNIVPFSEPNYISKNIAGLSYSLSLLDQRWVTTVFTKYYSFRGKAVDIHWDDTRTVAQMNFDKPGFGLASTYFVTKELQFKGSYERTYRLPEGFEMFGDGLLTQGNAFLTPERSHNYNFGGLYSKVTRDHKFSTESNYFLRKTDNLIRIEATGITSQFVNLARAMSSGVEASFEYSYQQWLSTGVNATYQNIINNTEFDEGRRSSVYKDRIPNIPYLFGNLHATVSKTDLIGERDKLSFTWTSRYVHEYYLKWPSQGDPQNKHVIPAQLLHNLELNYSLNDGRYNVTVGSNNVFDAMAFDKFRVQRPGRAIYMKIRYFIQ